MTTLARFSEFLVEHAKITRAEACDLQERFPLFIGLLAVNRGYLSYPRVNAILEKQRVEGGNFGDVAERMGWLTAEQLETVLADQRSQCDMIGRVLLGENRIGKEVLEGLLDAFHSGAEPAPTSS